jgi:opacity protein-like surface antigen
MAMAIYTRLRIVGCGPIIAVAAISARARGQSGWRLSLRSGLIAFAMVTIALSSTYRPAAAQPSSEFSKASDIVGSSVFGMQRAVKACDYDEWMRYKGFYDRYIETYSRYSSPLAAPPYPIPCTLAARELRATNVRRQQEPDKLYSVGRPIEPAKLYTAGGNLKPTKLYSVGTLVRPPQPFDWYGFYISAIVSGNFNTLGQTERFKMNNAVTNDFSDSSRAAGFGVNGGFWFTPYVNNVQIGASASIDILKQNTIRNFPPGPFFLGQTINAITTLNGQIGVFAKPGLLFFGEVGPAFVNVDQKLNFSGPVTSVNQTVTGLNVGFGVVYQVPNWQVAGIPVAITAQYNHIFLPATTFDNPGSPLFLYSNQSDIDQFKIGIRVPINPNLVGKTPIRF